MDLVFEIQKTNCGIRTRILKVPGVNFQAKWTNLTFFAQICSKRNLKLEIHKTKMKHKTEMSWVEVGTRFSNTLRRTLFLNDATALLHDKMYRYILHKSYLIMLH